ncbi:uncharacterized protein [Arachis hypogaea]|uniref:uncharacterized protein n=1 Tax=Arachis hypogaea TaxID=3818 RepID=UPI003B21673C
MANFIVEMSPKNKALEQWKLHVDGSLNNNSDRAGIILENENRITIEQLIRYDFLISNNQVEYEALLDGLTLANEISARTLEVYSDSQIVSSQINRNYQKRDALLQQYLSKFKELITKFDLVSIRHISRERNARADLLSKLASTKSVSRNRLLV